MNWTTKVEDGLGTLHMRTQTDDEQRFRDAITPRKGFTLEVRDLSPTEFEIACVPIREDPAANAVESNAPIRSLSPEDLEVVAAQTGIDIEDDDRPIDLANKIRKAQKRAS